MENTKLYGYFRISTLVHIIDNGEDETWEPNVYFSGIFDYDHAQKMLEKDFEFEKTFYKKVEVIRKTSQEYKVKAYLSDTCYYELTEYFDDFAVNHWYGQPVYENSMR